MQTLELVINLEWKVATVTTKGVVSHTFEIDNLLEYEKRQNGGVSKPKQLGAIIFSALFQNRSKAWFEYESLTPGEDQIILILEHRELHAIPFEYAFDGEDYLVTEFYFARGIAENERQPLPAIEEGLHITVVPSNPLDKQFDPLNIEEEWELLTESLSGIDKEIFVERVAPPTLDTLRERVVGKKNRVVHFMGHGLLDRKQMSNLVFEDAFGKADKVTGKEFVRVIRDTVYLVTLNACQTATYGTDEFSNLADAMVRRNIPYVLAMREEIRDDDALLIARRFYSEIARGETVEDAMLQMRASLVRQREPSVGIPVLYTSVSSGSSFQRRDGELTVIYNRPKAELLDLPKAHVDFVGRIDTIRQIGEYIVPKNGSRIVTIQGLGGQGKTALTREIAERFSVHFPLGTIAISAEPLPTKGQVLEKLVKFLDIQIESLDLNVISDLVIRELNKNRLLLIIDNAETILQNLQEENAKARSLATWLRDDLTSSKTTLLVTSRERLGWPDERVIVLDGLNRTEGALLFRSIAVQRRRDIVPAEARYLSELVDGHPLTIRLLASAFLQTDQSLETFIETYRSSFESIEDDLMDDEHRHRSTHAAIATSVKFLPPESRDVLSKVWVFRGLIHAIYMVYVVSQPNNDMDSREQDYNNTPVEYGMEGILNLADNGLLIPVGFPFGPTGENNIWLFKVPNVVKAYAKGMPQNIKEQELLERYIYTYRRLLDFLGISIKKYVNGSLLFEYFRPDLEYIIDLLPSEKAQEFLLNIGVILRQRGELSKALTLYENALINAKKAKARSLEATIINNIGLVYGDRGDYKKASEYLEMSLEMMKELNEPAKEVATKLSLGQIYTLVGNNQKARAILLEVLSHQEEMGYEDTIPATLHALGNSYLVAKDLDAALKNFRKSVSILRERNDLNRLAKTLLMIGQVHFRQNSTTAALTALKEARELSKQFGDARTYDEANSILSIILRQTGERSTALDYLFQLQPKETEYFVPDIGDGSDSVTTQLNAQASIDILNIKLLQETGNMSDALKLALHRVEKSREMGSDIEQAATLKALGWIYTSMGRYTDAIDAFEKSIALISRDTDAEKHLWCAVCGDLANVYINLGKLAKARDLYEMIRPIQKSLGISALEGYGATIYGLALISQSQGEHENAIEFLQESLGINANSDNDGHVLTLNALSISLLRLGKVEEAREKILMAIEISRNGNLRRNLATVLNTLANIELETGDLTKAKALFEESLPIRREVRDKRGEAFTTYNLANIYAMQEDYSVAMLMIEEAETLFAELMDFNSVAYMQFSRSELYRRQKRNDDALNALETAIKTSQEHSLEKNYPERVEMYIDTYRSLQAGKLTDSIMRSLVFGAPMLDKAQRNSVIWHTIHSVRDSGKARAKWRNDLSEMYKTFSANWHPNNADALYIKELIKIVNNEIPIIDDRNPYAEDIRYIMDALSGKPAIRISERERQAMVVMTITYIRKEEAMDFDWKVVATERLTELKDRDGGQVSSDSEYISALIGLMEGQSVSLPSDSPYFEDFQKVLSGIRGN